MKSMIFAGMVAAFISGCASTVTTYDSEGKLIGSCKSKGGFVIGGGAGCTGTANQEGKAK
jgi:hypothetical protein